MTSSYAVWRIIPSKPGCVDFCGTVYADCLTSAEAQARLMYPVSGGDYLDIEEDHATNRLDPDAPDVIVL